MRIERSAGLLRIVIDGEKGNVLTSSVLALLEEALIEHAPDNDIKLVMIEGAGKNFSFGASVEEHRRDQVRGMLRRFHDTILRVLAHPVPTAALVRGKCLGGAFELALACTFVLAHDDASFACPEVALGVFPPVLAALGPMRLGAAWTDRLLLTGQALDAKTAEAIGFAVRVDDDGTDWYDANIEKHSAFALRQALAAARIGSGVLERTPKVLLELERQYMDRVAASKDGNEGIEAFLAKRAPQWVNA
jgi:cyclohexa-1,5-dienecarbonyl-CoA hydratase